MDMIHAVPSANSDGTAISQYGFNRIGNIILRNKLKKMAGKTTTWKTNARGVDLNRKWEYQLIALLICIDLKIIKMMLKIKDSFFIRFWSRKL